MNPRIYVRCLAAYNNGLLHGDWIDADQNEDDIYEGIRAILRSSPEAQQKCTECDYEGECNDQSECPECGADWAVPEEWAIHDNEDFGGFTISEHEDIKTVSEIGLAISEMEDEEAEAFCTWADNSGDLDVDAFREVYCGCHKSVAEYAEQYMEDCGGLSEVPENLRNYFDFELFARDMELGGDIWASEGEFGVHIFSR